MKLQNYKKDQNDFGFTVINGNMYFCGLELCNNFSFPFFLEEVRAYAKGARLKNPGDTDKFLLHTGKKQYSLSGVVYGPHIEVTIAVAKAIMYFSEASKTKTQDILEYKAVEASSLQMFNKKIQTNVEVTAEQADMIQGMQSVGKQYPELKIGVVVPTDFTEIGSYALSGTSSLHSTLLNHSDLIFYEAKNALIKGFEYVYPHDRTPNLSSFFKADPKLLQKMDHQSVGCAGDVSFVMNLSKKSAQESEKFTAAVVGALLPNVYLRDPEGQKNQTISNEKKIKDKFRAIFNAMASSSVDFIILPTLGCGRGGNHPETIARFFMEVWDEGYSNLFIGAKFCTLDPKTVTAFQDAFTEYNFTSRPMPQTYTSPESTVVNNNVVTTSPAPDTTASPTAGDPTFNDRFTAAPFTPPKLPTEAFTPPPIEKLNLGDIEKLNLGDGVNVNVDRRVIAAVKSDTGEQKVSPRL